MAVALPWQHKHHGSSHGTSSVEGDYSVRLGELIASPTNSVYEVFELLGRGTFGQVLKCWRRDSSEVVALKVLKNIPSYAKQGQVEVDVLTRLSKVSAEEFNFVRAYESFQHRGHICIAFELLQINLYDYLKQTRFTPLPLQHVRPIAQQVLVCLQKLQELGLVHADLKPENIMLVDPERQPFRVKVIDFGSTTPRSKRGASTYLQSRYYRAPEVILGLPYAEAIDMWSLGCVLAELFLGWPLFPGVSEFDQISYICQTIGSPPLSMLTNQSKATRFFVRDQSHRGWVLKTPQQHEMESGVKSRETRKYIFTSLSSIAQAGNHRNDYITETDCIQFVSLLGTMLTIDPTHRATPTQALQHPFITMQHLAMHTGAQSVRDWIQSMQVCCHSKTTASVSPPFHTLTSPPPQPHFVHPSQLIPQPSQIVYRVAPSTLAYLPMSTDLHPELPHTWVEADTGYVSAESSPATAHTSSVEVPNAGFLTELPPPPPPHIHHPSHPLPLTHSTPHPSLHTLSPHQHYILPLGYPASFMRECLPPHNPFCRL